MKQHSVDYLSLIFGLAFVAIAVLTLSGEQWALRGTWAGQWVGPVVLIAIGLAVLAPRKDRSVVEVGSATDPDMQAALEELPPEVPLSQ